MRSITAAAMAGQVAKFMVRHPHGNGVKSFLGGGGLVAPHLVADAVHGNGVHAAAINDGREIVLQSRLPPFLKSLLDGTQSFPVNAVFYCVFFIIQTFEYNFNASSAEISLISNAAISKF